MPIELTCTCGRALNLRDELAGSFIRCPECAATLQVPMRAEVIDERIVADLPARANSGNIDASPPTATPPPLPPSVEEEDNRPEPPPWQRPHRRRKKSRALWNQYGEGPLGYGKLNTGLLSGFALLLTGILFMIFCLPFPFIPVFGIVFIVVGIIALIKGIFNTRL